MEVILRYFPELNPTQRQQFAALMPFYTEWNEKINVISRKDLENLYLHHVLHSLGLAKIINFAPFTEVIDVGTGGGFPGIPLAILFPQARFHLIDSTLKKIKIVQQYHRNVYVQHLLFLYLEPLNVKYHVSLMVSVQLILPEDQDRKSVV